MTTLSCSGTNASNNYELGAYEISGTMEHILIEGGCWKFVATNDSSYELTGNNINQLLHNGIYATLMVRDLKGGVSICMVGKIVEVVIITEIKEP